MRRLPQPHGHSAVPATIPLLDDRDARYGGVSQSGERDRFLIAVGGAVLRRVIGNPAAFAPNADIIHIDLDAR